MCVWHPGLVPSFQCPCTCQSLLEAGCLWRDRVVIGDTDSDNSCSSCPFCPFAPTVLLPSVLQPHLVAFTLNFSVPFARLYFSSSVFPPAPPPPISAFHCIFNLAPFRLPSSPLGPGFCSYPRWLVRRRPCCIQSDRGGGTPGWERDSLDWNICRATDYMIAAPPRHSGSYCLKSGKHERRSPLEPGRHTETKQQSKC